MERLPLASAFGWGFPSWEEDDVADLMIHLGIDRVQIFRDWKQTFDPAAIRRRLADRGLTITSFHAAFGDDYDPSWPDESLRTKSIEHLKHEADFCQGLGGTLVVVHPGDAPIGDAMHDPQRADALTRSAEQLLEIGRERGIVMCLENIQPGQMGSDMAMLRRIVDRFDDPYLALNYDCGHANLTSDPMTVLRQGGERIASVHLHDNDGQGDEHLPPGYGDIDMDAICRGLAEFGYRGEFTLELMESVESVRQRFDERYRARLEHWIDLASGIVT